MKVLHVTSSSHGGAGIAALRLHKALSHEGILSGFISRNLTINFENQVIQDLFFSYRKHGLIKKISSKFLSYFHSALTKKVLLDYAKIHDLLDSEIATLPFSNYQLHKHPLVLEADIIHLHWVGGILHYPDFFLNCKKPIVWTLHDMNPFQGLFHYHNDQIRNAKLAGKLDDEIIKIKSEALKSVKQGAIVSPSQWLLRSARSSTIFQGWQSYNIPNSVDTKVFRLQDRVELRNRYGIDREAFVLGFAADNINNKRKGFAILSDALTYLEDLPMLLLVIGEGMDNINTNIKHLITGSINSEDQMAAYYALSDGFVLPSIEDNLPNVMLEALSCGTPVIGFAIGGLKEYIIEDFNGCLATEINALSLAMAIRKFFTGGITLSRKKEIMESASVFSPVLQAQQYKEVYSSFKRQGLQ